MRIGSIELSAPLFLSPLAGYTNLPMRLTLRELGGLGWATTDLINARSLIERNHKALQLAQTSPADRPMAIQLFGSDPAEMRDAAKICEDLGAASVDINMGCPVKKVVGIGGGAAMMTELKKTAALAEGMVKAVKIPVTAKMRLGWDEQNLTAPDLARVLVDVGIAAIFVHGRTRAQGFSGTVNLAGIRSVGQAVPTVPVIGNGDVTTPEAAAKMIADTGCAGVSIGRGAFYDPWIFRRTAELLATGKSPAEPTFSERLRVMRRHFDLTVEIFGETLGCRMFRKIAPWYAKRFGPAVEFKKRIITILTRQDFDNAVNHYLEWRKQFCDANGDLLPRFVPAPMVASFMRPAGESDDGQSIPVPKGPVERW
jgi:nifR3 family TIM-barrel protein